jgi:death-on-curing protein
VLEAHRIALLRGGGLDGIRDQSLIESAIGRPYDGYYRAIHSKAAALTHSLAKNHGFLDGNKRTAALSLALLLDRSGYELVAPDVELAEAEQVTEDDVEVLTDASVADMILELVENRMSFDDLKKWFKARIRSKKEPHGLGL